MRSLILLNSLAPVLLAILAVAATRDSLQFPLTVLFIVVLLGLTAVNLVAAAFLWRRHRARALLGLPALLAGGVAALLIMHTGTRWMLADTPAAPETFLQGARMAELERLAGDVLARPDADSAYTRLVELGFRRVETDTARGVVVLGHVRGRTWHEYLFAQAALGAPYSGKPRLSEASRFRWGDLRDICRQADPAIPLPTGGRVYHSRLATAVIRQALGDSLTSALASQPVTSRIGPEAKRRVLAGLNRQLSFGSRLIEAPEVTLQEQPPVLQIAGRALAKRAGTTELAIRLLASGVLLSAHDKRHLLVRTDATELERNAVEWLQLGLMNELYDGLFEASDYTYDRQLAEHWYYRVW